MSVAALQACLERERAHARASLCLDEELGTHHGISWFDFVLLHSLHDPAASMPDGDLAARLGLLRSQFVRRIRPLEKLGLVTRLIDGHGRHVATLTSAGRRVMHEASETAAAACARIECA